MKITKNFRKENHEGDVHITTRITPGYKQTRQLIKLTKERQEVKRIRDN